MSEVRSFCVLATGRGWSALISCKTRPVCASMTMTAAALTAGTPPFSFGTAKGTGGVVFLGLATGTAFAGVAPALGAAVAGIAAKQRAKLAKRSRRISEKAHVVKTSRGLAQARFVERRQAVRLFLIFFITHQEHG